MIVDDVFSEFGSQYTYNPDRVVPTVIIVGTKGTQ